MQFSEGFSLNEIEIKDVGILFSLIRQLGTCFMFYGKLSYVSYESDKKVISEKTYPFFGLG
jgi:hypothetical protein